MSDIGLSTAAHVLLTQLRSVPTATQFDAAAAEELIGRGYAALVPAGAMIEITEAGRLCSHEAETRDAALLDGAASRVGAGLADAGSIPLPAGR